MPEMENRHNALTLINRIIDEVRWCWHLPYAGSMVVLGVPKGETGQTGCLIQKFLAQFPGGIGIVLGDKRRDVSEFA